LIGIVDYHNLPQCQTKRQGCRVVSVALIFPVFVAGMWKRTPGISGSSQRREEISRLAVHAKNNLTDWCLVLLFLRRRCSTLHDSDGFRSASTSCRPYHRLAAPRAYPASRVADEWLTFRTDVATLPQRGWYVETKERKQKEWIWAIWQETGTCKHSTLLKFERLERMPSIYFCEEARASTV
jgi:hypothetical protein